MSAEVALVSEEFAAGRTRNVDRSFVGFVWCAWLFTVLMFDQVVQSSELLAAPVTCMNGHYDLLLF